MIKAIAISVWVAASAVCMLAFSSIPARASLTYEFQQTAGTPDYLHVSIQYTIADSSGVNASFSGITRTLTGSLDNLLDFRFLGGVYVDLSLLQSKMAYCATANPSDWHCDTVNFNLSLHGEDVSFYYGDDGITVSFNRFGPSGGTVDRDGGTYCSWTGVCKFEGSFVMVPEPATLATFSIGLLGLAQLRRRHYHARRRVCRLPLQPC